MQNFDWDKFKREKIAVHCKTEEEAKDFCRKMHEQRRKWGYEDTYSGDTKYAEYKEKTCYYNGRYFNLQLAKKYNYTILEWNDYMKKEFTKADLKDWMVIEQNNKERYLVIGDSVFNFNGYNPLTQYNYDLTNGLGKEYRIEKVFKVRNNYMYCLKEIFNDENLELIWERTETTRMTAEEMRQKLEELTGEKIEVEPSGEEMVGACYRFCRNYPVMFCNGCPLREVENCNFEELANEELKECYEKVMEYGKK